MKIGLVPAGGVQSVPVTVGGSEGGREERGYGGAEAVISIDVGGTFTDAVLFVPGRQLLTAKVLTTSEDQSLGVLEAIKELTERAGFMPSAISRFVHGTTAATNALLERKGGRTGFVTTAGFRDLLVLRRQTRPSLYELTRPHADPLVPSELVIELDERNSVDGLVKPVSRLSIDEAVRRIGALDLDAVAICLLFSFAHPQHEAVLAAALRERFPTLDVVASSELVPEFREYERASTTVADAYLTQPVKDYLRRLVERCIDRGIVPPLIMQSSGGMSRVDSEAVHPAHLVLSGPAGGLNGAHQLVDRLGIRNLVTLDMGGTSTDVGVIVDGAVRRANSITLGGLPLRVATFDLTTIGAGGGSVAWLDAGGALRVGPRSAGAMPGPACYGRGGQEPTVTDAHVVLGHVDTLQGLGGLELDPKAARNSVETVGAGFPSIEAAAAGIVSVADIEMAQAVRTMTIDRGLDPHDFHLVAFGGAGPLHAVAIAEELDMGGVVIPMFSGVLSALGMALSDLRFDFSQTILTPLDALSEDDLSQVARTLLQRSPYEPDSVDGYCELRYQGQSFELSVPYYLGDQPGAVRQRFEEAHERVYGFRYEDASVEVVTVRVGARREVAPAGGVDGAEPRASVKPQRAVRAIWSLSGEVPAEVLDLTDVRSRLLEPVRGPAVIQLATATCLVPEGWSAEGGPAASNLIIQRC